MCKVEDFEKLSMDSSHRTLIRNELDGEWHPSYLPKDPSLPQVKDATVLDVGAGCGETALFYLSHGAKRIIGIESDSEALEHFRNNYERDPRVLIIPEHIDIIKIDIEGAERGMLFETHFPVRFKLLKHDHETRLWRVERDDRFSLHTMRIKIAHLIRRVLDRL